MPTYGCDRKELAHNVAAAIRKIPRVRNEILALSGLRREEIARLKWSDVDLDAGTVTIARNRVQVGAKVQRSWGP